MPTANSDSRTTNRPTDSATDAPCEPESLGIIARSLLQLADAFADDESGKTIPLNENRRALPRRVGMCSARVVLCPNGIPTDGSKREWLLAGTSISGDLRDVTLRSVAFELPNDLLIGQQVLLRLENRDQGTSVDAVGEVLRTSPAEDAFLIVCKLTAELRYEDVVALGWMPFESDQV